MKERLPVIVRIFGIMLYVYFPDIFVTGGTGMRVSVSLQTEVNDSHIIIDVHQQTEPDGINDEECKPGHFMSTQRTTLRRRRRTQRRAKAFDGSADSEQTQRPLICRPCSMCPAGQEIMEPCSSRQDTKCGICTGLEGNRTCQLTGITASIIPELPVATMSPTGKIVKDGRNKMVESESSDLHVVAATDNSNTLSEKPGDTADFIGALVTSALSLVMFILLLITAPIVIYLKMRDWVRYGRRPTQDIDDTANGVNLYCPCLSFKPCHDIVPLPPLPQPPIADLQVHAPHTTITSNSNSSKDQCWESDSHTCAEETINVCEVHEHRIHTCDSSMSSNGILASSNVLHSTSSSAINKYEDIPGVDSPLCYQTDEAIGHAGSNGISFHVQDWKDIPDKRYDHHPEEAKVSLLPCSRVELLETIPVTSTQHAQDELNNLIQSPYRGPYVTIV